MQCCFVFSQYHFERFKVNWMIKVRNSKFTKTNSLLNKINGTMNIELIKLNF
jgi:hypothetical protein